MGFFIKKNKKTEKADDKKASIKVAKKGKKSTDSTSTEKKSMKDLYADKKEAVVKKEKTEDKKTKSIKNGQAYKILIKPLITEKASVLASENKYFFEVSIDANKIEIAKAIAEIYGVHPTSVNIIRMQGKKTRYGRTEGKKKNWKKAIVTLPKGETIKIYEGV